VGGTRREGEAGVDVYLEQPAVDERHTPRVRGRSTESSKMCAPKIVETTRWIMAAGDLVIWSKAPKTPVLEPLIILQ
jgi:hypothetical protein